MEHQVSRSTSGGEDREKATGIYEILWMAVGVSDATYMVDA